MLNRHIIKTPQFILRPFRRSDAKSVAAQINDKEIARNMLSIPHPYTINDARSWIQRCQNAARHKNRTWINFAIEINGKAVGGASIFRIHDHKAEIGYWLGKAYWGKGIMTEAVNEIVKFGFGTLGLRRIYAHTFTFNQASIRVLEKAGFTHEALLRKVAKKKGRFYDWNLYAKVR